MRVGRVPYLHNEPFYFDMPRRGIELHEIVPSAMAAAVLHGEVDAGPIPLVDCFRLTERLQPVAGFGVTSVQRTGHVFLYSTRPVTDLNGAQIGVIDEASTAPRLLHVLLRCHFQVRPAAYVPLQSAAEAFLLVGDQGLRRRLGIPGFPHTYDLGKVWHAWTGLPFVFSRWMARKDLAPKELALLQDTLYVGLEEGVDALFRVAEPREDLLMLPRDIARHAQNFRYYIGSTEQRAIEQFQTYLHQLDD